MKNILFVAILIFFILVSCQRKKENITNPSPNKDLRDFLKISLSENENIFVGKLSSINNSPNEDFEIKKTNDSIFISKKFLESDNFDGKKIIIEKNNSIKKIVLNYKIALLFNGTEKANKYIPLHFNIPITINDNESTIPLFSKIKDNKGLLDFVSKNNLKIKEKAYDYYLNYYNNIPEEELKNCCITDFNNYNRLKKINKNSVLSLDIEQDLGMYLDYESLIINLIGIQKSKPIVFTKNINNDKNISIEDSYPKSSKTNNNWKGSYKITTKIISQFDNKEADVLYTMTIESNQKAILSIGAENVQDYWCEGEYRLIKEDNILHAKGKCDQDDMDDFYLKNENGKYYIKSKRFINQNWQELLTTD